MILDAKLVLSDAQAITTAAAHDSTNTIDTERTQNLAVGTQLYLNVRVGTAFTSGGSATLAVKFQSSVDDSTYTDEFTVAAIAVASLVAGYQILKVALPQNRLSRYWKCEYTIATAAMTAGTIDAWISID